MVEYTKQWMRVTKYDGECIKNMEWSKSYKILFSRNKQMHLSCCSQRCLIESMNQWMIVMKCEGECIKNIEWVELYKKCTHLKQTNALTYMFPTMVDWIDETIKLMTCNAQTVTIIIDSISIYFSIDMWHSKQLYPYK